jgi:hypothetical protein
MIELSGEGNFAAWAKIEPKPDPVWKGDDRFDLCELHYAGKYAEVAAAVQKRLKETNTELATSERDQFGKDAKRYGFTLIGTKAQLDGKTPVVVERWSRVETKDGAKVPRIVTAAFHSFFQSPMGDEVRDEYSDSPSVALEPLEPTK